MADCRGRRSFRLNGLLSKSRIELVKLRRRSLGLVTRRNSPAFISSSQILSLEKESTPNYMQMSNSINQTVDWEMFEEADVEKDDDVGKKNRGDLGKGAAAGLDIHLPPAAAADSSAMSVKEKAKKNDPLDRQNRKAERAGGQVKRGMKPLPSETAMGKEDKMTRLLMWLPEPDFRWPISSW